MTTMLRKSLLTLAGLSIAGGVAAGPASTALAADTTPATTTTTAAAAAVVQGGPSHLDLSAEQTANVKAIIAATKKAGMDQHAAVIAVATAMQESKLQNLGHLGETNDHDSLGLFQQRPTSGWGTPEQLTNPDYATTAFLNSLKAVDGWHDRPVTQAAQTVQVSAYPDAYAQWEKQATDLVGQYWTS